MKISNTYILFILSMSMALGSCIGAKSSPSEQLQAPITAISHISSDTMTPWVDELFFNEGQLCQHLRKMHQDRNGNLWFGTNNYNIMRYDGDSLLFLSQADGVPDGRITAIIETADGALWFGSSEGLIHYDGSVFTTHSTEGTMDDNEVWSLCQTSDHSWLVGTTNGVFSFDEKTFTKVIVPKASVDNPSTIYGKNRITAILKAKDGTIYYGTDGYGITRFDGESYTHITKEDGLPDNLISELYQDSKGRIWIGTMYGGISLYTGGVFTNFTADGAITGEEVGAIYEDANGDIWFAAENHGIYKYDGRSFTNYYEEHGLNTNGILSIMRDREGRFWFGGWGGLYRFDNNRFTSVTKNGPWEIAAD